MSEEGDDIVQFLEVDDANNSKVGGSYSSRFQLDLTKYADKTSAVNKILWHCNAAGTITVKSITLTRPVVFNYKDDEVPLTTAMFHAWSAPVAGEDQGAAPWSVLALNEEISNGALVYGNANVNYLQYAVLDGYKEIRIYGAAGIKYRLLFNRETDGGKTTEKDITSDENGLATCYISDLPYVHLNAIKLAWGTAATIVKGLCVSKQASSSATNIKSAISQSVKSMQAYDLSGRQVNSNAKGLLIVNGKKMIRR